MIGMDVEEVPVKEYKINLEGLLVEQPGRDLKLWIRSRRYIIGLVKDSALKGSVKHRKFSLQQGFRHGGEHVLLEGDPKRVYKASKRSASGLHILDERKREILWIETQLGLCRYIVVLMKEGLPEALRYAGKVVSLIPGQDVFAALTLTREKGLYLNLSISLRERLKIAYGCLVEYRRIYALGFWNLDLKPENYMIDEAGNVKLCDGAWMHARAEPVTEDLSQVLLRGTQEYAAPEAQAGVYCATTDIYALAMVLIFILFPKEYSKMLEHYEGRGRPIGESYLSLYEAAETCLTKSEELGAPPENYFFNYILCDMANSASSFRPDIEGVIVKFNQVFPDVALAFGPAAGVGGAVAEPGASVSAGPGLLAPC